MQTIYKSSNGVSTIPLETRLLSERKIFLFGEIGPETACSFVEQAMFLTSEDSDEAIHIYINSPGGTVSSGLLIYDCLKSLPCQVNLYCLEIAASMAAIILAGGQKGRRFILPHSKVMIHEPLVSGGLEGSATKIQQSAERIMETKRIISELLVSDTGKSIEEIERAIAFDNFMNAQESVEFGICDEIITSIF